MLVRRFVNWLRNRIAALPLRRGSPRKAARVPMLIGQGSADASKSPRLHASTFSNWLDNGRRLRPFAARRSSRVREELPSGPVAAPPDTGAAPAGEALALGQPCESALVSHGVGTGEAISSGLPAPATDAHLSPLEGIEQLDATQRRLVFLQYLVRQGIYNEGYALQDLPPQYHHSAGMDEPADGQN
jgi:hypothetical protein